MECTVCNYKFSPTSAKHQIVGSGNELFDAYDCPMCGCQIIAKERKPIYISNKMIQGDLDED